MRKIYYTLFLMVFLIGMMKAQKRFTYVEDASFSDPTDLFGYRFIPKVKEVPKVRKDELGPRDYSFGIMQNNLFLNYDGEKMIYNIQSINPTEYGFILALLNASNIKETGHLKLILDGKDRVRALVLKRTTLGKEEVFHIGLLDEYTKEKEEEYYTDLIDLPIDRLDSIWGIKFKPYFLDSPSIPLREVKLMRDSVSFTIYEDILITEKKKNRKDSVPVVDLETFDYKAMSEDSLKALADYIKVDHKKIISFNYATMEENGDYKMNHKIHIIRKINEKEDKEARELEERFMLEINIEKGDPINIFLTEYRTISSIHYMGNIYSARFIR